MRKFLLFSVLCFLTAMISWQGNAFAYQGGGTSKTTVKKLFVDPSDMMVSFDFQNVSIADVIRMIARVSNMNVLIGSGVKGTVTMKMHDVPLKDVFSIILEAYGLGMVRKDGIYYINSSQDIESVITAERKEKFISEPKITKVVPINYVSPNGLISKVQPVLSPGGTVLYDKSLHSLIITDIRENVDTALNLLKMLDKKTPQVEIAAKIVEVETQYTKQLGINWNGNFYSPKTTTGLGPVNFIGGETSGVPAGPGLSPTLTTQANAGTLSIGIVNADISINATLQALQALTKANTLASPKVVVLNNQTATIEKGETVYLPGVAGVGAVAAPQAITGQISLNITPHIMDNGDVKLVINATNNAVSAAPLVQGASATVTTESANSTVIIKSGQTIAIGGVYQLDKSTVTTGVPVLEDIPLFGWLFKANNISYTKDELLIFVTPRIIKS